MRILLIEDDAVLGAAVRDQIAGDGHSVDWVQRLDAADTAIAGVPYDLVLLDLMLPDGRGLPFLRRLRARGEATPVIILTALDQVSDRIEGLNAGADDLIPGVEMMAIRSDKLDKYAQPDGRFIGAPGKPTGVGFDATELRGARNITLDGLDHREVAFHKLAFAAMYEHIAGKPPASMFIAQEPLPILNGKVTGLSEGLYTNIPAAGAEVEIFEVDAKTGERKSAVALLRKTTGYVYAVDGVSFESPSRALWPQ